MIIACWYQWCHQEIVSLHGFPLLPSCPKYSQASMPLFGVRCLPAAPGTFPAVPTNFPKVGFHWTSLGPMPIPQPIVVIKGRKFFILQILSYRGLGWPIQSTRPNGVFPQGNSRIAKQNQQPYIYINCRERGRNSKFESWVLGSIVYMKMKAFLLNSYALILFSFFPWRSGQFENSNHALQKRGEQEICSRATMTTQRKLPAPFMEHLIWSCLVTAEVTLIYYVMFLLLDLYALKWLTSGLKAESMPYLSRCPPYSSTEVSLRVLNEARWAERKRREGGRDEPGWRVSLQTREQIEHGKYTPGITCLSLWQRWYWWPLIDHVSQYPDPCAAPSRIGSGLHVKTMLFQLALANVTSATRIQAEACYVLAHWRLSFGNLGTTWGSPSQPSGEASCRRTEAPRRQP